MIGSFAILMSLFAPSISFAIAADKGSGSSLIEICSVAGIKLIDVANDGNDKQPQPAEKAAHSGNCPYCFTMAIRSVYHLLQHPRLQ